MLNLGLKHGDLDTLAHILVHQAPTQPSSFPAWLVRFRAVHLVQFSLYWQTRSIIQAWGTLFTADPSIFYVSKATSPWVTSIHSSLFYGSIFSQQWSHTWTQGVKKDATLHPWTEIEQLQVVPGAGFFENSVWLSPGVWEDQRLEYKHFLYFRHRKLPKHLIAPYCFSACTDSLLKGALSHLCREESEHKYI